MARLPISTPVWYLRPLFWWQRRRYGAVLEPIQAWARRPRALLAFLRLSGTLRRTGGPLSPELRSLIAVRVSQVIGCDFCVDMNGALLVEAGASSDKLFSVGSWRDAPLFSESERIALEYAEAVTCTPPAVSDELFRRVRSFFSEEAIVEMTAVAAFQNMSARFNTALGTEAHGFCALH